MPVALDASPSSTAADCRPLRQNERPAPSSSSSYQPIGGCRAREPTHTLRGYRRSVPFERTRARSHSVPTVFPSRVAARVRPSFRTPPARQLRARTAATRPTYVPLLLYHRHPDRVSFRCRPPTLTLTSCLRNPFRPRRLNSRQRRKAAAVFIRERFPITRTFSPFDYISTNVPVSRYPITYATKRPFGIVSRGPCKSR